MNKVLSLAYFAGGSKFTLKPFIALQESTHNLKMVLTKSPKRAGRGKKRNQNFLLEKAVEYNIPIETIDDLKQITKRVLKSNQKTILLAIYNNQNQRR